MTYVDRSYYKRALVNICITALHMCTRCFWKNFNQKMSRRELNFFCLHVVVALLFLIGLCIKCFTNHILPESPGIRANVSSNQQKGTIIIPQKVLIQLLVLGKSPYERSLSELLFNQTFFCSSTLFIS